MTAQRRALVVGCGVVGATIAYELSQLSGLEITVLDQQQPAQASTGAALGVLMGVISHKVKGRNWRLRQASLERYGSLIPELEERLQRPVPWNHHGLLHLCFDADQLPRWRSLQEIRQQQGYELEIWSTDQLQQRCPDINLAGVAAAIYSPQDRQINPTTLTWACIEAAQQQGSKFHFHAPVTDLNVTPYGVEVYTPQTVYSTDMVILAAGLGTPALTQALQRPLPIGPVLGQAVRLHLAQPLNRPEFQPVISGHDIHLVPLGGGDYWVGATVEFPPDTALATAPLLPQAEQLDALLQGAIAYCPPLATATRKDTWFGLRPRPHQAAPVIQPVTEQGRVWIASGHYRNGVLLAPATALMIAEQVRSHLSLP